LLPGQTITTEKLISLQGGKYFDAVFKYADEARYEFQCWYGMVEELPMQFYTGKVFVLWERQYGDRKYHEQPQLTEFR